MGSLQHILNHPITLKLIIIRTEQAEESVTWESEMVKPEEDEFKCYRHLEVIISYLLGESPDHYPYHRVDLLDTRHFLQGTVKQFWGLAVVLRLIFLMVIIICRKIKSLHPVTE